MEKDFDWIRVAAREELKRFWFWVSERHRIYLMREAGQPPPWTQDEYLRDWKFTNVFRQLDRGTVWLTQNIIEPRREQARRSKTPRAELLANIVVYREFNNWETWEELFPSGFSTWEPEEVKAKLRTRKARGEAVFTSAHIVRGEAGRPKIDSAVDILTPIVEAAPALVEEFEKLSTLEAAFHRMKQFHFIGDFMSYEFVSDFYHTPILGHAVDALTWANPGPGATRGLQAIFPGIPNRALIPAMQWLREQSVLELPSFVPPLEMRDVEHSLCEFLKYDRAWKRGPGGKAGRVRFRPTKPLS